MDTSQCATYWYISTILL